MSDYSIKSLKELYDSVRDYIKVTSNNFIKESLNKPIEYIQDNSSQFESSLRFAAGIDELRDIIVTINAETEKWKILTKSKSELKRNLEIEIY